MESVRCSYCKRPLKLLMSIKIGIGKGCLKKYSLKNKNKNQFKFKFKYNGKYKSV